MIKTDEKLMKGLDVNNEVHLLPCPFCGMEADMEDEDTIYPTGIGWKITNGRKHYVHFHEVPPEQWCYSVNCVGHYGGCGAEVPGDSKLEAIEKWNRRS